MTKCLRYFLILLSGSFFLSGSVYNSYNLTLLGILFFWFNNIVYSFEKIKSRVFFMVFNAMIFVFLISRPAISMIKGNVWWHFQKSDVIFALSSLMITLIFLLLGEYIAERNISLNGVGYLSRSIDASSGYIRSLKIISLILFYVSMAFFLISETEKMLYMRSRDYVEMYTTFKTSLPYVFTVIASMYKYFLCIFLSSMPKKSESFFPLFLYLLSAVPSLVIGLRNPIVLNAVFVFLYYFIRDSIGSKDKWIGISEKCVIIFAAPLSIMALGMLNYAREGSKFTGGAFSLLVDFFYKQGVSFDVLCIGHNSIPKIKYTGFTNYTFGGIIDYFTHNTLAQVIWGAKSLGSGNNINMALYSNSFSHRMSYVSRGYEYLQGHGWGSSYLLETYADFGYIGIIIFSLLMGILFGYMMEIIKKGSFWRAIVLVILTGVYFCPRDSALGWINFIIYGQFLVPMFTCYFLAKLCIKSYSLKRRVLYNGGKETLSLQSGNLL